MFFVLFLMNGVQKVNSVDGDPYAVALPEIEGISLFVTSVAHHKGHLVLGSFSGVALISPGYQEVFNVHSGHLKSDLVTDVIFDKSNFAWASTDNGLFYYSHFLQTHGLLDSDDGLGANSCMDLEYDEEQSKLWAACGKSINLIKEHSKVIETFDFSESIKSDRDVITQIKRMSDTTVLLTTYFETMLIDTTSMDVLRKFQQDTVFTYSSWKIDEQHFLIANANGVRLFNVNEETQVEHFRPTQLSNAVSDSVLLISEFSGDEVILTLESGGMYKFNTKTFSLSENSTFFPYMLPTESDELAVHRNFDDGFVLASETKGVRIYPGTGELLKFFDKKGVNISVIHFSREVADDVLFGDNGTVFRLNKSTRKVTELIGRMGTILDGIAYKDGFLISSIERNLIYVDFHGNILDENVVFEGLPDGGDADVISFLELEGDKYLLGMFSRSGKGAGIYYGTFEGGFTELLKGDNIYEIMKMNSGKIYALSANKGLYEVDVSVETPTISHFKFIDDGDITQFECLTQLNETELLMCTRKDGIVKFDTITGEFSGVLTNDTRISKTIRDIFVDKNQNIWISTANGLVVFDDFENDGFYISSKDGLRNQDFGYKSSLRFSDNEVLFFGAKDLFTINVNLAMEYIRNIQSKVTNVDIIEYSASNLPVSAKKTEELKNSFYNDSYLALPHDILNLQFKFTHDNLLGKDFVRYETRMQGLETEWRTMRKNDNQITFSTLPPGDYVFQLKVNDSRSLALQQVKEIQITIFPPWWQTTYAYLVYIIVFVTVVYFVQWFRARQLKLKNLELSEKVKERTATIENLLNQKQTFFANVSHEFRTPLSLIMGPIDFLSEKLTKEDDIHQLSIMRRNTSRLMRLVDQILELAKFETSKHLPKEVYEIQPVLDVLSSSFSSLLEAKRQEIKIKVDGNVKVLLIQDSLEMILGNLISNAIKYCPEGSLISITSIQEANHLIIEVADNGRGIAPENLEVLFERFTRFDAGEDIKGSGIGLALVKQLVDSNGGVISVESALNKGTIFKVRLPINVDQSEKATHVTRPHILDTEFEELSEGEAVAAAEAEPPTVDGELSNGNANNKFKILVVEDNADLRSYLTESLSPEYEIQLAKNGEEGLKKAQQNIPDLILSDVLMPLMNGYELSNAIRSDDATSHIPIILLTAKGDDLSRMKGWKENVDDYLTKPFKLKELRSRISRLISIRDILKKKHTSELNNNLAIKNNEAISFQTKRDKEFFERFEKVISEHYAEENFSRAEAASYMALSERQLNRKLSALVDYNFSEYLRKYRLQKGRDLLLSGKQVTEVSYDVGFNSPSYFSSCFKAEYEKTPKQYVEEREKPV